MMCRREGGRVAATLAPGWGGGSWAGVGERVTDLGRRADGVASCYEVRDVDTTERIQREGGGGGVRGGERSLRRRYYSKPEDYQYP